MSKHMDDAAMAANKKALIAEGELFRVGLLHARMNVAQALHPQALLHGVVDHAMNVAHARMDNLLAPTGLHLQTVLPYLLTAVSFVSKRRLVKPALALTVAAAAGLTWFMRRKSARPA